MSGSNRLVLSENAMNNGSESALTSCLEDANKEAIRISDKKKPVAKKESNE